MFGVGFTQGFQENQDRIRTRRAKVNQAFQQWKQANPYASAADFQNAVRSIGGGDLTVATALPGQQAIQRMAQQNQDKKAEDDQRKKFEAMERKLNYNNTLMSAVGNAVQLMGDKADLATVASQLDIPVEQIKPAFEQAQAKAQQAQAEKDQAAQIEALTRYQSASTTVITNGGTPEQAKSAGSTAANQYLRAAGVDVSLGNFNSPSQFSSSMGETDALLQSQYDARVAKEVEAAANTVRGLFGSNTSLQTLLLEDENKAIDAALALSGQKFSDDKIASLVRADLESSVGEVQRQLREQQENAALTAATSLVTQALSTEDGILADPEVVQSTVEASLIEQNMDPDLASRSTAAALENSSERRAIDFDKVNQPADPSTVISGLQQLRTDQAARLIESMSSPQGKQPGQMMGSAITMVSNPEKAEMARALAQINFASPSEAQDIVDVMAAYVANQRGKGPTPNAAELIEAVAKNQKNMTLFEDDLNAPWIGGLTVRDQIKEHYSQEFASTADLIASDLSEVALTDVNYILAKQSGGEVSIDITMAGIEEVTNGAGSKSEKQIQIGNIREAIQLEIEGVKMYRNAVLSDSLSVERDLIVPPSARLGFDVSFDKAAYVAVLDDRIVDLEKRFKQTSVELTDVTGTDDGGLNPARVPAPGEPLVGTQNIGGRDVFFTDVINASDEAYERFEHSLVDTLLANSQDQSNRVGLQRGAPALYGALLSGVPDERVVKGVARGIEAYYYFLETMPRSVGINPRQIRQAETGYSSELERIGLGEISERSGYKDGQSRDRDAQYYAAVMFKDATAGMDPAEQEALLKDFWKILAAEKGDPNAISVFERGGDKAEYNQHGLPRLDLPRLLESGI